MNVFDANKTRVIGLPCGEKSYDNMLSHFHLILECDGQMDRIAMSILRICVLRHHKNLFYVHFHTTHVTYRQRMVNKGMIHI